MPSTLPTEKETPLSSGLYVVATPIGHMEDITIRALKVLAAVDTIAAEDTRHTRKILTRYQIETPLVSYHDHNKEKKTPQILKKLQDGLAMALVSDAGTPSVSDPGYYLVKRCVEMDIPVTPIPGVSAAIAALSISGLPSDGFVFVGFLPRKAGKRQQLLETLKEEGRTLVFYESPKRLLAVSRELLRSFGNRDAVLARELTKVHEEILRVRLEQLCQELSSRTTIKGECTLLVSGHEGGPELRGDTLRKALARLRHQGDYSLSSLAKKAAALYGLPRKQVYDELLKMNKEQQDKGP